LRFQSHLFAIPHRPRISTLFPYTTLFRSKKAELSYDEILAILRKLPRRSNITFVGGEVTLKDRFWDLVEVAAARHRVAIGTNARSEEHTSELQSPDHLVCRRLLETKNEQN